MGDYGHMRRPDWEDALSNVVTVSTPSGGVVGNLRRVHDARGLVVFCDDEPAPRSDYGRTYLSEVLLRSHLTTFVGNLVSELEAYSDTRHYDVGTLSRRLIAVTTDLVSRDDVGALPVGYLGFGVGAAAALQATLSSGPAVRAVVSCGGLPDLVNDLLPRISVPTLFVVAEQDDKVAELNRLASHRMHGPTSVVVVRGTRDFKKPGTIDRVAARAAAWFLRYLTD